MADYEYPFDPTGTNPLNRITDEVHVITPTNDRYFNFFVPRKGPFFEDSVQIQFRFPDNQIWNMVYGVDYYFTNQFLSASKACAKSIFGSITFLNNQVQGVLKISYNTIGGSWIVTPEELTEIMADQTHNPRTTTWEQIAELPYQFPVIDHDWDLVDMVGMSDVVASIDSIYDAMVQSGDLSIAAHIQSTNNPHLVTKEQVNLGQVQNYPVATTVQVQSGVSNATYMTPALTKLAVDYHGATLVDVHAARTDNPHNVGKAQIGLPNVDNFATATIAQAQAGIATNLFMTPALVRSAFDSFISPYADHVADTTNPHQVDKTQVGLNNVQNYAVSTLSQAQNGSINTAYMTPSTTAAAISFQALVPLNEHVNDHTNPHNVDKGQVGLSLVQNYGIATPTEAQDLSSNTAYMTPVRVLQALQTVGQAMIDTHANRLDNPHATTADQVGAYTIEEVDDLLLGYLPTTGIASDSAKLGNKTGPELFTAYGHQKSQVPQSITTASTYVWYKLTTVGIHPEVPGHVLATDEPSNRMRSAQFFFAGGTPSGGKASAAEEYRKPQLFYLNLDRWGSNFELTNLSAVSVMYDPTIGGMADPVVAFGWVKEANNTVSLYVRLSKDHTGFTLSKLDGYILNVTASYYGDAAPASITLVNIKNGGYANRFGNYTDSQFNTEFGDAKNAITNLLGRVAALDSQTYP